MIQYSSFSGENNRCNDKCQNKAAAWLYYGGYVLLVAMGRMSGVYLHLTSPVPGLNMVSKLYEYLYIEAELRKPTYAENFFLYMFTWLMFFVDTVLIAVVMMTIYLRCGRYISSIYAGFLLRVHRVAGLVPRLQGRQLRQRQQRDLRALPLPRSLLPPAARLCESSYFELK